VLIRAVPAAPAPDGRPQVTITVIDTGIGIAADDLPLLFQPFSRVDAASNRQFGGTGLGLAISRELIELMGGHLDVSSQPGQGSQFYFTIPLTLQATGSEPPRPATDCLAAQRLLIIDDNAHSLQLLSEHASAWGMNPTSIPDGSTAVARLRDAAEHDQPYAVAVIDQQMPGLDGVALTRQIIADTAISAVKLVLLTSGSYHDDEVAAAVGAVAVLPKPICPSQMYNCLQDLLDPEAAAHAHLSPARQRTIGGRGLILLAEDNEINQIVAVDNLSLLGYRVDIARDGIEAVRLAGTRPYQAILMDCQMPRMDGYDATAEVRRSFEGGYDPLYQCAYMLGALQFRALHHELVDSGKMTDRQYHDAILHENMMPIEILHAILTGKQLTPDFKSSWRFLDELQATPPAQLGPQGL